MGRALLRISRPLGSRILRRVWLVWYQRYYTRNVCIYICFNILRQSNIKVQKSPCLTHIMRQYFLQEKSGLACAIPTFRLSFGLVCLILQTLTVSFIFTNCLPTTSGETSACHERELGELSGPRVEHGSVSAYWFRSHRSLSYSSTMRTLISTAMLTGIKVPSKHDRLLARQAFP